MYMASQMDLVTYFYAQANLMQTFGYLDYHFLTNIDSVWLKNQIRLVIPMIKSTYKYLHFHLFIKENVMYSIIYLYVHSWTVQKYENLITGSSH